LSDFYLDAKLHLVVGVGELCRRLHRPTDVTGGPPQCWLPRSLVDQSRYGGPAVIEVSLSDVRVIMTIIHVLMVKLWCQIVMG
jgi:hypothetical protein